MRVLRRGGARRATGEEEEGQRQVAERGPHSRASEGSPTRGWGGGRVATKRGARGHAGEEGPKWLRRRRALTRRQGHMRAEEGCAATGWWGARAMGACRAKVEDGGIFTWLAS